MKRTTKNRIRFGRSSRWALMGLAAALNLLVHRADADTQITSVRLTEGGAMVALKFNSEAGQTYRVETSPTLAAGTWADAGVSVEGDGSEKGFNIPAAGLGGAHFFRVTVETFMETVPVGNAGNVGDVMGNPGLAGRVDYAYRIGKYEVTNAQYVAFLNAVAISDPNGLYHTSMGSDPRGGIERSGESEAFTYAVKIHMGDKPVNYVIWYHAARFCNWMHNGRPSGVQDSTTTENGAYTLTGRTTVAGGTDPNHGADGRNAGAKCHLPSDNEWYKAAYHQPASVGGDVDDYWLYPTHSNTPPTLATADETGNINNDTANIANANNGADWNGQDGNVTTVGSGGPGSAGYYGAFDMGGNVAEWDEQAARFPKGYRTLRGGGALGAGAPGSLDPTSLKSSSYGGEDATWASSNNGFRIATP